MQRVLSKIKSLNYIPFVFSFLFTLASGVTVFAVVPQWRDWVRNLVFSDQRVVLARAVNDLTGKGDNYTFIKIKNRNSLWIEIYRESETESNLIAKLQIANSKDGYFDFKGQATNLAIADIDADGVSELLVPSFDENLVARLNVFKYHSQDNSFERVFKTEGF